MATAATQDLENEPGESLRDALDDAFAQHADTDGAGSDAPKPKPAAAADDDVAVQAAAEQRARDETGRFAKAAKAAEEGLEGVAKAPAPPAGTPTAIAPAPLAGELKAPASWTPAARELWKDVPPSIQAEVHRREGEAQRVLQQTAQTRQFVDAFENIVRPYELFIRQENSNPLQAVQNLMSTAAEFRVGTPARKVELVAGIIKNFNVDIDQLDQHLARGMQPGAQTMGQIQQPQQFHDPRLDQLLYQQQQQALVHRQQETAQVQQTLADFGAKHEFYGDVSQVMGDILEMRARRGEVIDLEAAYKQACNLHEGVSTILTQRQAAQRPGGTSQAVLRAKRAAASVKGDGAPHDGQHVPKDDSIRASLEAAFEASADR